MPSIGSRTTVAGVPAGVSSGAIVMPHPMPTRPMAVPTSFTVAPTLGWKPAAMHMLRTRRPSEVAGHITHASSASWLIAQPRAPASGWSGGTQSPFADSGETYLVVACIAVPTRVLRLTVGEFAQIQVLDGLGARELAVARCAGRTLLIRVNFILGTPADPQPALDSQVYEWDGGKLQEVATFPTCGGTDVAVLSKDVAVPSDSEGNADSVELVVTNSLTPELRFAAETVRYELTAGAR